MLVDPIKQNLDQSRAMIMAMLSDGVKDKCISKGIYEIGHFNFGDKVHYSDNYPDLLDKNGSYLNPYGVCDSVKQLLEICPMLEGDKERQFCVSVTKIDKSTQPAEGGWRWHKWGPYIGVHDTTREYIYDEPLIESVFVYHVFEV